MFSVAGPARFFRWMMGWWWRMGFAGQSLIVKIFGSRSLVGHSRSALFEACPHHLDVCSFLASYCDNNQSKRSAVISNARTNARKTRRMKNHSDRRSEPISNSKRSTLPFLARFVTASSHTEDLVSLWTIAHQRTAKEHTAQHHALLVMFLCLLDSKIITKQK